MILTTTEAKAYLNQSTTVSTYDTLIDWYIPVVTEEVSEISKHRYHDSYHWIDDDGLVITSSNKTITLDSDSTYSFLREFSTGDTIDIISSYNNDGFYTVSSITSSHILVVSESIIAENSTDYDLITYIYRCDFDKDVKKIAAKMVWWNVQNTTTVTGAIASEGIGSYSVSYRDGGGISYGQYPDGLISGLKKAVEMW